MGLLEGLDPLCGERPGAGAVVAPLDLRLRRPGGEQLGCLVHQPPALLGAREVHDGLVEEHRAAEPRAAHGRPRDDVLLPAVRYRAEPRPALWAPQEGEDRRLLALRGVAVDHRPAGCPLEPVAVVAVVAAEGVQARAPALRARASRGAALLPGPLGRLHAAPRAPRARARRATRDGGQARAEVDAGLADPLRGGRPHLVLAGEARAGPLGHEHPALRDAGAHPAADATGHGEALGHHRRAEVLVEERGGAEVLHRAPRYEARSAETASKVISCPAVSAITDHGRASWPSPRTWPSSWAIAWVRCPSGTSSSAGT